MDNKLTGKIPPELSRPPILQEIYLGNNQLTGSIPAELANLPYLRLLSLYDNNLTGQISESLGNFLAKVSRYFLYGNKFECPYPSALQQHFEQYEESCVESSGGLPIWMLYLASEKAAD
jgi:hypothetical protein